MTIAEAAAEVLRGSGQPMPLEEILHAIKGGKLYAFNSPDELTILREQMRRHTDLVEKKLRYEPTLFRIDESGRFYLSGTTFQSKKPLTMRRIRRASDKEDVIERLAKKGDTLFSDIWRLLIFAATVGFNAKIREPVREYDSGKSIDISYFTGSPAWPGLLHLIGLVESQDPRVLNPDLDQMEFRISLFEEYANAGLRILREAGESRDYSLDALLSLVPISGGDAESVAEVSII